jgi:hypothetical protein
MQATTSITFSRATPFDYLKKNEILSSSKDRQIEGLLIQYDA